MLSERKHFIYICYVSNNHINFLTMAVQIDTSTPNTITYIPEELGFTILGGIRMDGLDRLRVTIRIEVINRKFEHYMNNTDLAALPLNHNLDLYNDVQVEKLIRKAA